MEQEDSGVSVIEFDKSASEPVVLSERSCTLKYAAADPSVPTPQEFTFPEPLVELEEASYQRYVDADLEEVSTTVALVEEYGSHQRAWWLAALGILAGILAVSGLTFVFRRRSPEISSDITPELSLTPFGILNRLKFLEQSSPLSTEQKERLSSDILALEKHYFERPMVRFLPI